MSPAEQRAALVELARAEARLTELRLRVLVDADRNQVGADSGATSTPAWLAHATKTTRTAAFRDLHLARKLDETFTKTRAALAAGLIDVEKAAVVTAAVEALTSEYDDLPPGTEVRAEAHMLDLATEFDAPALRKLGKRLFEVVCPEAADAAEGRKLAKEEAKARALAHFSVRDNGDGTSTGPFKLPTLHAELLKKALEALTSPRRIGEARLDPATGKKLPHATLLGQGLMELVENHLSDLPSVNGSPFTLVVTIGYDALMSGIGVADPGHRAPDLRRGGPAAGVQGRDHPGGARRRLDPARRRSGAAAVRPLPEDRDQPPLRRLRRRQLRPATGVGRVPPRGPLAPRRGHRMRRRASRCAHRTTRWPTTPRPTTRPASPTARSASPDANRSAPRPRADSLRFSGERPDLTRAVTPPG